MLSVEIKPPEGFSFRRTTRALGVGKMDSDGVWWWATTMIGSPVTYAIEMKEGMVRARVWGSELLPVAIERLLGFDDDPSRTPGSAEFRSRMRGLHLGSTGDVHGAMVKAVLGQKVTTSEARESMRSLVRLWGAPAPGPRSDLVAIPGAAAIAERTYDEFHEVGIERRRAGTLIEVSRRIGRLEEIHAMSRDAAYERLEAIRGIGPWSAAMVMGIAWGDRDAVLLGDFHLPNTVAWAIAGEPRADDNRMLELLEPFRPHRRRFLMALKQAGVHAPRYGPRTARRSHL